MIAAATAAGSALAALALWATRRRYLLVACLAAVMLLQNLATMLTLRSGVVPIGQGELLLVSKEVFAIVALALSALILLAGAVRTGTVRLSRTERLAILFFAVVAIGFARSGSVPLAASLAGARSLVILPALYLLGLWLGADARDARRTMHLLVAAGAVLAVFGLLEAYVLPEGFWLAIGHEEYYLMKRGRPVQGQLFENMRYWVGSTSVRRIASLTGDPLISSYLLAFPLWLLTTFAIVRRRARPALVAFCGVMLTALTLTFSRGAFATLVVAAAVTLLAGRRAANAVTLTLGAFVATIVVTLAFEDVLLRVTTGAGHIEQLRQGLNLVLRAPLGLGTGTAGAAAAAIALASGGGGTAVAADSFVGSLLTQVGVPGLALFLATMLSMVHDLYRLAAFRSGPLPGWWYLATATFLAGLLVMSTVNESGYGFVAVGLVFVWAGMLVGVERAAALAPSPTAQHPLAYEPSPATGAVPAR